MQSKFIKNWNQAWRILHKPGQTLPADLLFDKLGQCAGFSAAFLDYSARADLTKFFKLIAYVTHTDPQQIAKLLESPGDQQWLLDDLYKLVVMIQKLQENQKKNSILGNELVRKANLRRINTQALTETRVMSLRNVHTAQKLIESLALDEGVLLGAEEHAYAIYRTSSGWIIFDANDKANEKAQPIEFSTANKAARKLISVVDHNIQSYAFEKMKLPRQTFALFYSVVIDFINLFRRNKLLYRETVLIATKATFVAPDQQAAAVPPAVTKFKQPKKFSKSINPEVLALRAIEVDDLGLLKRIIIQHKLNVNQAWQLWQGDPQKKVSPFQHAEIHNSVATRQFLIAQQRDQAIMQKDLHTANNLQIKLDQELYHAVMHNDLQNAQQLVELGASANTRAMNNFPILFYAVFSKNTAMVQLLIEHGADINIKYKNVTALVLAEKANLQEIIELLTKQNPTPLIQ